MFEDVLDKFKDDLTESLVACGEANRVHKILSDVEMNREDYLYFYNEGLKANQDRLDDNQEKLDKAMAILEIEGLLKWKINMALS